MKMRPRSLFNTFVFVVGSEIAGKICLYRNGSNKWAPIRFNEWAMENYRAANSKSRT